MYKVSSVNYVVITNRDGRVIKKVMVGSKQGASMDFNFSREKGG